jgi:hypothetical protein
MLVLLSPPYGPRLHEDVETKINFVNAETPERISWIDPDEAMGGIRACNRSSLSIIPRCWQYAHGNTH